MSLFASDSVIASRGDPTSVQMAAYLAAEATDLFGRTKRLRIKHQRRGFMGQILGSVRNCVRYFRTASGVGAAGLPVLSNNMPVFFAYTLFPKEARSRNGLNNSTQNVSKLL